MLTASEPLGVPQSFREAIDHAIAKHHRLKLSRTARKSVSQPTSILQPPLQAVSYRAVTKAICAVQASRRLRAAFFAYFFLLLKKSRSPKASEASNNAEGPNVLDQHHMIPTERSFIPDVRQEADNIKSNWYYNLSRVYPPVKDVGLALLVGVRCLDQQPAPLVEIQRTDHNAVRVRAGPRLAHPQVDAVIPGETIS